MISTLPVNSIQQTQRRFSTTDIFSFSALAIVAAWVFFFRLGHDPLTDWDEAWHAQISSEILSRGDWLWLHYRGLPYFNKPPLTFWLRAIAFRAGGVNETSARFFPALFGYSSVLLLAWFYTRLFDRRTGVLAGFILCTSWLFTLHHAGRSGETDSTLIFFHILTFISLWNARENVRWFYAAGVFTALGWMSKGSTAYLIWPVMALGRLLEGRPLNRWQSQWIRHAIGGIVLAFCMTVPWQGLMLWKYGRSFATAFYVGEGALPALQAIENHPGDPTFYAQIFHAFFEPWFLLAVSTAAWVCWRKRAPVKPAVFFLLAWAGLISTACTLFATKMVWYATPALPAIAGLAALAGVQLVGRRHGVWLLMAAAGFGMFQIRAQSAAPLNCAFTAILVILIGWRLVNPPEEFIKPWSKWASWVCLMIPIAAHLNVIHGAIVRGDTMGEWAELSVDDEPWRELSQRIDREFPGQPIMLVGVPLNPAAYFYLHHLRIPVSIRSITYDQRADLHTIAKSNDLIVTRIELSESLRVDGLVELLREHSLIVLRRTPIQAP